MISKYKGIISSRLLLGRYRKEIQGMREAGARALGLCHSLRTHVLFHARAYLGHPRSAPAKGSQKLKPCTPSLQQCAWLKHGGEVYLLESRYLPCGCHCGASAWAWLACQDGLLPVGTYRLCRRVVDE